MTGNSTIRFSVFELDLEAGELRRNGSKIRLQEQPLQILVSLLERPGKVVTREELRRKLWPADTFVDFDHGLNAAIRRLREALDDSAETPRFVETVARRGYRFIAPVQGITPANLRPPVAASIRPRWRIVTAACSLVLLLIAITSYLFWRQSHKPAPPDRKVMLAVLPFENLSGDPSRGILQRRHDPRDDQLAGPTGCAPPRRDRRNFGYEVQEFSQKDQRDWA